jgi:hypothetical protein
MDFCVVAGDEFGAFRRADGVATRQLANSLVVGQFAGALSWCAPFRHFATARFDFARWAIGAERFSVALAVIGRRNHLALRDGG